MEQLLKIVEENARISLEDLAVMVGDTPAGVAARLDEYKAAGIIHGYHTLIDWEKAGVPRVQAIIELRVTPKRDCGCDEIAATVASFEAVSYTHLSPPARI